MTPSILFPKVECFFYAISFLPNQLVRFLAAGSQASSVVADREREDQILDLQAESLLASFRESLDPIQRVRSL